MIDLPAYTPTYQLLADGSPFGGGRVLRIEATDAAGHESDEMRVTLDDHRPQVARPKEGTEFELSLGYKERGAPVYIGTYVFEEIERNGYERECTLIAKAVDYSETLKEPKTRAWSEQTFGEICTTIAQDHGLKSAITEELKSHQIDYIAQTDESDLHFLTRLSKQLGAIVSVKDGHLLVTIRGSGKTASGQALPRIMITPDKLIADNAYNVWIKPRSKYSKVAAKWRDRGAGKTRRLTVQAGEKGPVMTLREVFQNRLDAEKAATAKAEELKAGEGDLSFEMLGEPTARAEVPISVVMVSEDADGDKWIASKVSHEWDFTDGGGAVTTVETEFGKAEKDDKKGSRKAQKRPQKAKKKKRAATKTAGPYTSILDR